MTNPDANRGRKIPSVVKPKPKPNEEESKGSKPKISTTPKLSNGGFNKENDWYY